MASVSCLASDCLAYFRYYDLLWPLLAAWPLTVFAYFRYYDLLWPLFAVWPLIVLPIFVIMNYYGLCLLSGL